MKPWILIILLSLSLSAWSKEFEFESFSPISMRHLKETEKFCEQMKSLGFSSNLFSENCVLTYELKGNTKDISLVYEKTNGKLVSILKTQFVRGGTTALLSSFLIDFSRTANIYKAMFERIQELSRTDASWSAVSWVAINREIFSQVSGLDEKLFPILFSFEDQLFAARSILDLPRKDLLEPMKVCEASRSWKYVTGATAILTAVTFAVIYKVARFYPGKQPEQQEQPLKSEPVVKSPRSPKILPAEPNMRSGTPLPNPETQTLVKSAQDLMKQLNNIKRGKSDDKPLPVRAALGKIKTKLVECLHAGEDVSSLISQIGGCLKP